MSSTEYPLAGVRKLQLVIAGLSFPWAIASIADRRGSPETIFQLITLILSICASIYILYNHRKTGKQHPESEILSDVFLLVLFLAVYIAGIVILSSRVMRYVVYARSIPHVYTNLACLLMWLSYGYTIFIAIYHKYLINLLKRRRWGSTMYILCPSCDRAAQASQSGWNGERTANPFDNTPNLYTDEEAEGQSLLHNEPTKQETGITN
ncbi:hypothetical protein ASPZODRAFT_137196 [Penicilliopsis zonata CBS 506.65]|uniref:Uncharacterized protein n=1 Tax=Penicilliopsis zonata CBS 506.65 TaxID=1073090 RepID=A0A1L9S5Y5_9EURO|nr:hypothetical protein ASPZODRAFT_137196 [Penicilliopsis zonata CBS 506.65]OJJ42577.1 hypothetical protein ASPZODRAFT_137196 [Penicilliopsis zonata CBS 506.65]